MKKLIKILSVIIVFCLSFSTLVACVNDSDIGNSPNHTCEYGEWTSNDDGTHTKFCKTNPAHKQTGACSGGVATETQRAICKDCNAEYGVTLNHEHVYDKEVVEEKYLDATATCKEKAKYYYSCECGAVGGKTFESGDLSFHLYEDEKCKWCEKAIVASDGLSYKLINNDTEYEVSLGSCEDNQIVIPSTYNNLPITCISDYGFCYNKKIESVILCNGIKNIGEGAFRGCSGLENVILPNGLLEIEKNAFSSCSNLTSIKLPNSLQKIGVDAFLLCSNLTSVVVPGSVKVLSEGVFMFCTNLKNVGMGDGIEIIESSVFGSCSSLESIKIPDSVISVGSSTFSGCSSLKQIEISKNLTTLGADIFLRCSALININVAQENPAYKSVDGNLYSKDGKTLVQYAIGKTETEFVVPSGVTNISAGAFYNSSALISVFILEDVESIGEYAFVGCKSLKNIEISKNVRDIGIGAFVECSSLEKISVDNANMFYKTVNNVLYTKDGKKLIQYASYKEESSFIIPNGVEKIDEEAFFSSKNLVSIVIPNSVKSIANGAFLLCNSIESITFEGTIEEWKNIKKGFVWIGSVPAVEIICEDGNVSLT